MSLKITVTESIVVRRPPDAVWDFTQDYRRRPEWDALSEASKKCPTIPGSGPEWCL